MSNLVPDDKEKRILERYKAQWHHPDPRLADIILRASARGVPASRIGEMVNADTRTLKYHYAAELNYGKDMLSDSLMEVAIDKALEGDSKILIHMLNKTKVFEEYERPQEGDDGAGGNASSVGSLDLNKLTLDELRTLEGLVKKAKPSIVVDAARKDNG